MDIVQKGYPKGVQNRWGGGVKATFGQCPKVSGFFLGMSSLNLGIDLAKYVFQQPNIQMLDLVHLSSFLVNFEGDYATILDFKVT